MALIKDKKTIYGIMANYWKVGKVSLDATKNEASFSLELYIDKEKLGEPLEVLFISDLITKPDMVVFNKYFRDFGVKYKDIYTACYMYVKENVEFFKDAVDDPEEVAYV